MSLIFKQILADGIAQISYLIGNSSTGTAAVIDPRPDVDIYLELARRHNLSITHIFETHIHADFMSGSRELASSLGSAEIYVSKEGGASYGFDHNDVYDGYKFEFGSVILTAHHTPGHTPEHISFLIAEKERENSPWGVITGDSLFVGSAGRPDLLGKEESERLVKQLFHTLREFYLELDDHVIIYPCHGAGSACGADIGDRLVSTIGYERKFNQFLKYSDLGDFKDFVISGAPPIPAHYPRMKKLNAKGPEVFNGLPRVPALAVHKFRETLEDKKSILLDTRHMLAFGGGHIEGAFNIGGDSELSVWAGDILDPEKPLLLVLNDDNDLEKVVSLLLRTGLTNFSGYLAGGMEEWDKAGFPIETVKQLSIHQLNKSLEDIQILDVRSSEEWNNGHIPGAKHCYLSDMREKTPELAKNKPVAVYCGSGYRASIAASLLKSRGFKDVLNVPGSWHAWTNAGYLVKQNN